MFGSLLEDDSAEIDAVRAILEKRTFAQSIADTQAALRQAGDPAPLLRRLGVLHYAAGRAGRALTDFWHASSLAPHRHGSRHLLRRWFNAPGEMHPEQLVLYPVCRGRGIDVGCGHRKTHPDAIGVDLTPGGAAGAVGNVAGQISQASIRASGDALPMFADGELDYVVARHNLEHYTDPLKTLLEWRRVLRPGGILGLVVPDDTECDTIRLDPTHKHAFVPESLSRALELIGGFQQLELRPVLFRWSFMIVARRAGAPDRRAPAPDGFAGAAPDSFDPARALAGLEAALCRHRAEEYALAGDASADAACREVAESLLEPPPPGLRLALPPPAPRPLPDATSFFPDTGGRLRFAYEDARGFLRGCLRRALGLPPGILGGTPGGR